MPRDTYEAPQMGAFMRRVVRSMVTRCEDGDQQALIELIATKRDLDDAIRAGAQALHDKGQSWAWIGRELGITRQAARQMYGRKAK